MRNERGFFTLSVLVFFVMGVSPAFSTEVDVARFLSLESGGETRFLDGWINFVPACREDAKIVRDEYETSAEFERRKNLAVAGCPTFPLEVSFTAGSVSFSYDADRGRFEVPISFNRHWEPNRTVWRKEDSKVDQKPYRPHIRAQDYVVRFWEPEYFDSILSVDKEAVDRVRGAWDQDSRGFQHVFPLLSLSIKMGSRIEKARLLRQKQKSLRWEFEGTLDLIIHDLHPNHQPTWRVVAPKIEISQMRLVDLETDRDVLVLVKK